jgi:putative Ca2+/H+ antiporter (TMEM165/GDT1 family)
MRQILVIFLSVFLAEMGDKTQLATMLFASGRDVGKIGVFVAAAAALVLSTAVAVLGGEIVMRVVSPATLKVAAGLGFIAIGIWTLLVS